MTRGVTKETLRMMSKFQFCIACSREHFVGHFDTKLKCLAQILTELLRFLLLKTCMIEN